MCFMKMLCFYKKKLGRCSVTFLKTKRGGGGEGGGRLNVGFYQSLLLYIVHVFLLSTARLSRNVRPADVTRDMLSIYPPVHNWRSEHFSWGELCYILLFSIVYMSDVIISF